jgi:hypothetical protein
LEQALAVARAIQDVASATSVSRLTLAELLDKSQSSRVFRELLTASTMCGLTTGGVHSQE